MSYKCGILIVTILALLSFTANASVDSELKGFVASIPALDKIFTSDVAINLIGQRAEQVVEHHSIQMLWCFFLSRSKGPVMDWACAIVRQH